MSSDERIVTRHPEGKQGVRIDKAKYDAMVEALLQVVPSEPPGVRFGELEELVAPLLPPSIYTPEVSVAWYLTSIKLDLEARGALRRLPGSGPQRLIRVAAAAR